MASLLTTSRIMCLLQFKKSPHIVLETLIISETIKLPQTFFSTPFPLQQYVHLPSKVKPAPSVASFKHGIKLNVKEPPKYYSVGTHIGQVLHASLRFECSSLNADLYREHIINSPSCQCRNKFWKRCFRNERQSFLPGNLRIFTSKALLFVRENASELENDQLFLQDQEDRKICLTLSSLVNVTVLIR